MSDEAYYSIKLGAYIIACFATFISFGFAIKEKNRDAAFGWFVALIWAATSWRG